MIEISSICAKNPPLEVAKMLFQFFYWALVLTSWPFLTYGVVRWVPFIQFRDESPEFSDMIIYSFICLLFSIFWPIAFPVVAVALMVKGAMKISVSFKSSSK